MRPVEGLVCDEVGLPMVGAWARSGAILEALVGCFEIGWGWVYCGYEKGHLFGWPLVG